MRKKIVEVERVIRLIKHAQFHVQGGNYNPIGYRCNGIEIKRKRFETTEELRARCRDSVEWPDDTTMNIFIPLR